MPPSTRALFPSRAPAPSPAGASASPAAGASPSAAGGPAPSTAFTRTTGNPAPGMTPATPADLALQSSKAMSDEQLLQLGENPVGARTLRTMADQLRRGPMSPERQRELDRIGAATFTPAGGLKLEGSPADKAAFTQKVRRDMMSSPSFAKLMNEANADTKHPVKLTLERNTGTRLDSFNHQKVDLSDLDQLPARPRPGRPEETTQGEVLAHMMREQRAKALQPGAKDYEPAHAAAITAQNEFRKDLGQKSSRLMPPNDEVRVETPGGSILHVPYSDGHTESLLFDPNRNLTGTAGFPGLPPGLPGLP